MPQTSVWSLIENQMISSFFVSALKAKNNRVILLLSCIRKLKFAYYTIYLTIHMHCKPIPVMKTGFSL